MRDIPAPPYSITIKQVDYPPKKRKAFVGKICDQIDEAKAQREEQREPQWKLSVAQYKGLLEREDAGPSDCKLDLGPSRELADAMAPRFINPIMGYRQMFVTEALAPTWEDDAEKSEKVSNHIAPKKLYLGPMYGAFQQAAVYDTAWVRCTWTQRMKKIRTWGKDGEPSEPVEVVDREGCFPKVVHRTNILYPVDAGDDIDTAPWIAERYLERPSESAKKSEEGRLYRKGLSEEKLRAGKIGEPEPDQELGPKREGAPAPKGEDAPRERWMVFVEHPEDGIETILFVDAANRIELGWVENWYFDYQRPYRKFSFREVIDSLDGESLMEILLNWHKAYTALLAMILDHSTRAVNKLLIAAESLGLGEQFKEGKLSTGFVEADADTVDDLKKSILDISLQSDLGDLHWVVELVQLHMNNLSSIASAAFGHELAERPTSSGTDRILTESQQPLSLMLERWLQFWADVHTMQYARYRQFKPEGMSFFERVEDGEAATLKPVDISWPAGYWGEQLGFRTKVSSQTMSREIRKQELLALLERLPQIINGLLPLAERALAGDPLSMLIAQLVLRHLTLIESFFEEFGIASAGGKLEGGMFTAEAIGEEYAKRLEMAQQEIAKLKQQLAQLVPPPAAAGVGGAAGAGAGAPGPEGVGQASVPAGVQGGGGPPPGAPPPAGPAGAVV